jgi:type IV secretory pathway VirB6-like protein
VLVLTYVYLSFCTRITKLTQRKFATEKFGYLNSLKKYSVATHIGENAFGFTVPLYHYFVTKLATPFSDRLTGWICTSLLVLYCGSSKQKLSGQLCWTSLSYRTIFSFFLNFRSHRIGEYLVSDIFNELHAYDINDILYKAVRLPTSVLLDGSFVVFPLKRK